MTTNHDRKYLSGRACAPFGHMCFHHVIVERINDVQAAYGHGGWQSFIRTRLGRGWPATKPQDVTTPRRFVLAPLAGNGGARDV
jgi:hypothetical protein